MLETLIIGFAVVVGIGILGLMFWVARAAQNNLERRARHAAAGGRRLSLQEQVDVDLFVRDELATPALRASDPAFDREDRDDD